MKVSIVTVNLNGNKFLGDSIQSVLDQDYVDLELVIVDGGSKDGSLDTIVSAANRDSRVHWISEPDRGISDAMNKGVALATGDLVGILHSDDCYADSQTLSAVVAKFCACPEAYWLTGGVDLINEEGIVFRRFSVRAYSFERLLRSNILFHPATFVRSEVLRQSGMFNPELKLAMDYDLWLRLGSLWNPIVFDRQLAKFRVHSGSCSMRGAEDALSEEFLIRRSYLAFRGRAVWPYTWHYQIKRIAHAFFIRGLRNICKQG